GGETPAPRADPRPPAGGRAGVGRAAARSRDPGAGRRPRRRRAALGGLPDPRLPEDPVRAAQPAAGTDLPPPATRRRPPARGLGRPPDRPHRPPRRRYR